MYTSVILDELNTNGVKSHSPSLIGYRGRPCTPLGVAKSKGPPLGVEYVSKYVFWAKIIKMIQFECYEGHGFIESCLSLYPKIIKGM